LIDERPPELPTRRLVLFAAVGVVFAPPAAATPAAMEDAVRALVGAAMVQRGKVKLELPPIVENGNTVPLTVTVDSPMSEADHVTGIHIFNEKNPQPYVAAFDLGPRAGKAAVSTRIRLADSQRVVAIARFNDGSFWSDSADVIVTLAACAEG
jgi:sulfur-oxidizing protein SoxY